MGLKENEMRFLVAILGLPLLIGCGAQPERAYYRNRGVEVQVDPSIGDQLRRIDRLEENQERSLR